MSWQEFVDLMQGVNLLSTAVRLLLALICGGVLGFEREKKKRPAGFRTYMLVSVGAALVMITNQYMAELYQTGDPARLGAQVVSGIGFLGAGTIVVTGRNHVRGLTTAAGLWAAACTGLAVGTGFYSGAIMGCFFVFVVMSMLHGLDTWVMSSTKVINIYVEFTKMSDVGTFMNYVKEQEMRISDVEITKSSYARDDVGVALLATLKLDKKRPHNEIIQMLSTAEGVKFVEEV